MTRRSRRNRPPLLADHTPLFREPEVEVDRPVTPATPRARIISSRIAGRHGAVGRRQVEHIIGRLTSGAPDVALGFAAGPVTRDEAHDALEDLWGWEARAPRAAIDPDRTLAALEQAARRIAEVARAEGRIAFATGRPASLLAVYRAVAVYARALGAEVLRAEAHQVDTRGGRAVCWVDDVAVVTDGASLLADDEVDAAEEWLFALGPPDLVVADQAFAGVAAEAGHETVALADFDSLAMGIAAARGRPVTVVPLQHGRPPSAYRVVTELLTISTSAPAIEPQAAPGPDGPHAAPDAQGSQSTT
jgi:hypothetical protein